jgi:hypothetical protein
MNTGMSTGMITGDGESASTLQAQGSAKKCFNAYAALNGMEPLLKTARDVFCDVKFLQKFAYYLTSVYKTKMNTSLMRGTVLSYIGCILIIGQNALFIGTIK